MKHLFPLDDINRNDKFGWTHPKKVYFDFYRIGDVTGYLWSFILWTGNSFRKLSFLLWGSGQSVRGRFWLVCTRRTSENLYGLRNLSTNVSLEGPGRLFTIEVEESPYTRIDTETKSRSGVRGFRTVSTRSYVGLFIVFISLSLYFLWYEPFVDRTVECVLLRITERIRILYNCPERF